MRLDTLRSMTAILATSLAVIIASHNPVQGGYTPPSQSGALLGEGSAFLADFGQWNAIHDNLPMQFLGTTSTDNRGEAGVMLFWLWLHDSASMLDNGASLSSLLGSPNLGKLSLPKDPTGAKIGITDPTGNGFPPVVSNEKGDDPPGGGSILGLDNPPLQNSESGPFSGDPPHPWGPKPSIDPLPEPSGIMLFSLGGIGLLFGWWVRVRKLGNDALRQLAAVE